MYFIYFLRSELNPDKIYIGYTHSLVKRLAEHNAGQSIYTSRFMPWRIEAFILADTEVVAIEAERYFKSPSGQEKFKRFAEANPDHPNPIQGFFSNQAEGRLFGRSLFMVMNNRVLTLTACD